MNAFLGYYGNGKMNSVIFDLNLTFSVEDHLKCQLAVATMLVISFQGFLVKKKVGKL